MNNKDIDILINKLDELSSQDNKPFPYNDCHKIINANDTYIDFTADLNHFWVYVGGYSSWGKKALRWDDKKINEVRKAAETPFFLRFNQYKMLEPQITMENTKQLYQYIHLIEEMRLCLLELTSLLQQGNQKVKGDEQT